MRWEQVSKYIQDIKLFNRLMLYQRSLLKLSTNEIELLSRIATSKELLSSKELLNQMSCNKVILSRLVKKMIREEYIIKINNENDERSYFLKITEKGNTILKKDYKKITLPISVLKENMEEIEFKKFMNQISNSNKILKNYYNKKGSDRY